MLRLTSYLVLAALIVWLLWSDYDMKKETRNFCKAEHERRNKNG